MSEGGANAGGSPFTWMARACFDVFQETRRVPHGVLVTTTLRNGRQFFSVGMFLHHSREVPGVVMLQGDPAESGHAMVIRDEDVVSFEFPVLPPPQPESPPEQFGFHPRPA